MCQCPTPIQFQSNSVATVFILSGLLHDFNVPSDTAFSFVFFQGGHEEWHSSVTAYLPKSSLSFE
jgi:hypothetical protein